MAEQYFRLIDQCDPQPQKPLGAPSRAGFKAAFTPAGTMPDPAALKGGSSLPNG